MSKGITRKLQDGNGLKIGIVRARWNHELIEEACVRIKQAMLDCNVNQSDIVEMSVPGSYELPQGAQMMLEKHNVDAVITVGILVKGQTMHFEYIAEAVTQGITRVSLDYKKPVIFGVLTCLSQEQVEHRVKKEGLDHGYEWGLAAVEMATHWR